MPRSQWPAQERDWRSRLARLVANQGLLRGTLTVRHRLCGRPNCRCTRGQKHASLYLVSHQDGQPRQLYIPREAETQVRRWVADYRRARRLLERISETYWHRLKKE